MPVAQLIIAIHVHAAGNKLQLLGWLPQFGELLVVIQHEGEMAILERIAVYAAQVAQKFQAAQLGGTKNKPFNRQSCF